MTVKEIISEYLKAHGYDGLCCEDCGCSSADLAPCGNSEMLLSCKPAHKTLCVSCDKAAANCSYKAEHDAEACYHE